MSCKIDNEKITCFNPSTGNVIKIIDITTKPQFNNICNKAFKIKEEWNQSSPKERSQIIRKFRKAIILKMDDFIDIICKETGKKPFEGMLEVFTSAEHMKNAEKLTKVI